MKLIVWINKNEVKVLEEFIEGKLAKPPNFTTTAANINQIAIILTKDDYYKLQDNS